MGESGCIDLFSAQESNESSCPCCAFKVPSFYSSFPSSSFCALASDGDQASVTNTPEISQSRKKKGQKITENKDNSEMMIPAIEAFEKLKECSPKIAMVDSHCHAHLERSPRVYGKYSEQQDPDEETTCKNFSHMNKQYYALTCSVSKSDWESTLNYASSSLNIRPALGIHPWYIESLEKNENNSWLYDLELLLEKHPSALVGEIGLCRAAQYLRKQKQQPNSDGNTKESKTKEEWLKFQSDCFVKQFKLAAKMSRPCTVHCVQQQKLLLDLLKDIVSQHKRKSNKNRSDDTDSQARDILPPAIALHSFSGTPNHVREILKFEKSLNNTEENDPLFYFGFSHYVNVLNCGTDNEATRESISTSKSAQKAKRQNIEAIQVVPLNRILAESDVHNSSDVLPGTAGAISYIAHCRHLPIEEVAMITSQNAFTFLQRL